MAAYPPGDFQEEYRPLDDGVNLFQRRTASVSGIIPYIGLGSSVGRAPVL